MGVVTESQVIISCDSCLGTFIEAGLKRKDVEKMAREDGWLISRRVTCPDCKPIKEIGQMIPCPVCEVARYLKPSKLKISKERNPPELVGIHRKCRMRTIKPARKLAQRKVGK